MAKGQILAFGFLVVIVVSNAERCAAESLACVPFLEYFRSSRGYYDSKTLKEPTTQIYDRAFGR